MVDMASIQAAAVTIKTAIEAFKLLNERPPSDGISKPKELDVIRESLFLALEQTIEAKMEYVSLQDELLEIKRKLSNLEQWDADKERYALFSLGGGSVYALKESLCGSEPAHYLCANCFSNGDKSFLNPVKDATNSVLLNCPTCQSSLNTGSKRHLTVDYAPE